MVKNLPADTGDARDMGSTQGQENPLEKEMTTCSSILAWRIPWRAIVHGVAKRWMRLSTHSHDVGSTALNVKCHVTPSISK